MCDVGQRKENLQFAKNMCFSQNIELPLSIYREIIDEIGPLQPEVCIVGTEPLLYSEIVSASKYTKEKGLKLSITTNGLLLKKYADSLVEMGLDDLWISLDGTREFNDSVRGVRGAFDSTIQGLRLIQSLKGKMKSQKPSIHVNYTISDLNCNNLVDFTKEMLGEGIDSINFSHLNFVTEEVSKKHNQRFGAFCQSTPSSIDKVNLQKIDLTALERQIKEIKKLFSREGVRFTPDLIDKTLLYDYYFRPEVPLRKKRCLVPWTTTSVQPNGDIILLTRCFHYVVGNVMKQHLLDIWEGAGYCSFRKELWKNRYFPACTRCCGML
jgi:MoaA/NifB/PqqE/SkfB family radical SAM enzyme